MEVMGVINLAGFKHVALVAEMPTSAPKEQKGAR